MNPRIQELEQQALSIVLNGNDPDSDVDKMYIPSEFTKKFAELIVRECVAICQDIDGEDNTDARSGRQDCAVEIREHFGVEEQVQDSKELHTCPYREEILNDYESLCDCDEEQQHQCAMDI